MKRGWLRDTPKTAAQMRHEVDIEKAREVWNLLSQSQKERFATAEDEIAGFHDYVALFCHQERERKR